jgi:hypothetical protein
MTNQNELPVSAAEFVEQSQVEEISLQIEELESRVAPNALWGS